MSVQIIRHDDSTFTATINNKDRIEITVTSSASAVSSWISITLAGPSLVVGLDTEWRPNFTAGAPQNPISLLQLCVGRRCLLFQLIHSDFIPPSLADFLFDDRLTFVGVGIGGDVKRLIGDYGLEVAKFVDLRNRAAEVKGWNFLKGSGLRCLVKEFLGMDLKKNKKITMSRWDNEKLNQEQVKYAAMDAFLSFELGKVLGVVEGCGSA